MSEKQSPSLSFFFFFLLPLIFSVLCPTTCYKLTTYRTEQQILLQFNEDLGYPPPLRSWNTSISHCNWTGIQCINGSVTQLNLSNQNIQNPIPPILCQLPNLSRIDFSYNNIPRYFPASLYNCTNLQYLDISQNLFVGPIPPSVGQLSRQLTHLSLSANNFTGDIPSSIAQLPALQSLLLDNNLFNRAFPAEIGNLSNLEVLWLANNPFAPVQIPEEFGNLTKLTYLWMSSTNIVGEIPASFAKLTSLVRLELAMNSLNGSIPDGIWMLQKLEYLYLWHNRLSGEINKTIGAKGLVEIDLSMNQLTGPIPQGFGDLSNLTLLYLYVNQLTGEIPTSIGNLPLLLDLRLFNNSLMGVLPPEMGKHSKLWNFEVNDNQLSGELPHFLCAGGNLINLGAFNNNFAGNLPSSLVYCPTLLILNVQNNNLKGEIPAGFLTKPTSLETVVLSHNSFSGNLTQLFSSNNHLTGKIPTATASLVNFTELDLSFNQLWGEIPSLVSLMESIIYLDLSNNQLCEKIPAAIGSLSALVGLYLQNNQLSGPIPLKMVNPRLFSVNLSSNQLSGEIPSDFYSEELTSLDLSNNQFVGKIPATIGSSLSLYSLQLQNNRLSGQIPPEIGNLGITILNISSNQLSGEIPIPLQKPIFSKSFISNPKLCSRHNFLADIPKCHRSNEHSLTLLIILPSLGALSFIVFATISIFLIRKKRVQREDNGDCDTAATWKMTTFYSLQFTVMDIVQKLTNSNLIGRGGGGMVYQITLNEETRDMVAVKKIWNSRKLDARLEKEFQAEVQTLGLIRHANIVKLLCCLSSPNSKLLVYEYMENRSLHSWLHRQDQDAVSSSVYSVLDWPTRLGIAIGVAKGLCYMHHDCSPAIVHRDVKSSNILLDSTFNAKIADFGLARLLVKGGDPQTVSVVAGSFGYMAPECGWERKAHTKMDVYSFGVVLLELTTGRKAYNDYADGNLAEQVWDHFRETGRAVDLIADEIREPSYTEQIESVIKLGIICTGRLPSGRPSMKEVLQVLLSIARANRTGDNGVNETISIRHT